MFALDDEATKWTDDLTDSTESDFDNGIAASQTDDLSRSSKGQHGKDGYSEKEKDGLHDEMVESQKVVRIVRICDGVLFCEKKILFL
jgi:hypothetical protein